LLFYDDEANIVHTISTSLHYSYRYLHYCFFFF